MRKWQNINIPTIFHDTYHALYRVCQKWIECSSIYRSNNSAWYSHNMDTNRAEPEREWNSWGRKSFIAVFCYSAMKINKIDSTWFLCVWVWYVSRFEHSSHCIDRSTFFSSSFLSGVCVFFSSVHSTEQSTNNNISHSHGNSNNNNHIEKQEY